MLLSVDYFSLHCCHSDTLVTAFFVSSKVQRTENTIHSQKNRRVHFLFHGTHGFMGWDGNPGSDPSDPTKRLAAFEITTTLT